MSKLLRFALAWLLAAALPIQGYAAQDMLFCGPAHHQGAEASDHGVTGLHDVGPSAPSHDEAAMGSLHGANESDGHHVKTSRAGRAGKCSACASCCGTAALTHAVVSVEVDPQHERAVATIPAGKPVESLGGLDRPPRAVLA